MKSLERIYRTNLSLLTDLYQLTMAYGYWKQGIADREAVFHLYFRRAPFGGKVALACGIAPAVEMLQSLHFSEADVSYLGNLKGANGKALFDEGFLNFLQRFRFSCDIEAVQEGEIILPNEPIMRVRGPLWQANFVETMLLNIINFSTLIATKAARVADAAAGDTVLEFGLRRAQGIDGGLTASRASYIGGTHATSNVAAGQLYGIPVRGTHAHAWVMAFEDEVTAFENLAASMRGNLTFLVDTYNTLEGVKNAIKVAQKMNLQAADFQSIRLDSGDLAPLSIAARKLLDAAGYDWVKIVASNDLDEDEIIRLKKEGAKIDVWGVGTRLVTAFDQPALGGVYKLAALRDTDGKWQYKMKKSEEIVKASTPGILNVRRTEGGDILYDELDFEPLPEGRDLLQPLFRKGNLVAQISNIHDTRAYARSNWSNFDAEKLENFNVCLEKKLFLKKT